MDLGVVIGRLDGIVPRMPISIYYTPVDSQIKYGIFVPGLVNSRFKQLLTEIFLLDDSSIVACSPKYQKAVSTLQLFVADIMSGTDDDYKYLRTHLGAVQDAPVALYTGGGDYKSMRDEFWREKLDRKPIFDYEHPLIGVLHGIFGEILKKCNQCEHEQHELEVFKLFEQKEDIFVKFLSAFFIRLAPAAQKEIYVFVINCRHEPALIATSSFFWQIELGVIKPEQFPMLVYHECPVALPRMVPSRGVAVIHILSDFDRLANKAQVIEEMSKKYTEWFLVQSRGIKSDDSGYSQGLPDETWVRLYNGTSMVLEQSVKNIEICCYQLFKLLQKQIADAQIIDVDKLDSMPLQNQIKALTRTPKQTLKAIQGSDVLQVICDLLAVRMDRNISVHNIHLEVHDDHEALTTGALRIYNQDPLQFRGPLKVAPIKTANIPLVPTVLPSIIADSYLARRTGLLTPRTSILAVAKFSRMVTKMIDRHRLA